MGGDAFACFASFENASYPIYQAFDGIDANGTWISAAFPQNPTPYIGWYNPEPLNIVDLKLIQCWSNGLLAADLGYLDGSDDMVHWTRIANFHFTQSPAHCATWDFPLTTNVLAFKYHRLTGTNWYQYTSANNYYWGMAEIKITAYTYDTGIPITALNTVWVSNSEQRHFIKY